MNKIFIFIITIFQFIQFAHAEEKWIVLTTIFYPTEALKQLVDHAEQEGWKVVVVGDKKTPKDWKYSNAIYLNPDEQKDLNYEITKHLPWNHYCRKNIGYLYAIQHGAKIIYETDDDNYLLQFPYNENFPQKINTLNSELGTVNVYHYFGQPDIWPRGYPLDLISSSGEYWIDSKEVRVDIIQGLVNEDPDVDAIFRLTQGKEFQFSPNPPCALEKYVICPFNTQNTIFKYDAFWGLVIPSTTSQRVCDIWRGLITQRLLWEINSHLAFVAPTAFQKRNPHNLIRDFEEEIQLYLQSGKLINTLNKWTSSQTKIDLSIISLYECLEREKFIRQSDVILINAWISDLKKVGYTFPEIAKEN
ncbi:MAG: STELLO glycosyltransferase family protein [Waddliaceae bacterium]